MAKKAFIAYFLGCLLANLLFQTAFLTLLSATGILYLDRFIDHLGVSALSGFLYASTLIFVFLISFVLSHGYYRGTRPISHPLWFFLAGVGVLALSNTLSFAITFITRDKETLLYTTFLLGVVLTAPVPWVLRKDGRES